MNTPEEFHSVDEVLGAAQHLDLSNILVISERENGTIVFLSTEMSLAQANWLIDRLKTLILVPEQPMRGAK